MKYKVTVSKMYPYSSGDGMYWDEVDVLKYDSLEDVNVLINLWSSASIHELQFAVTVLKEE